MSDNTSEPFAPPEPLPPEADIDRMVALLEARAITLDMFTASASSAPPCGGPPVILSWHISKHPERATTSDLRRSLAAVRFELNLSGVRIGVPAIGTREVHPPFTTTYTLFARLRSVAFPLGSVTVLVDESRCMTITVTQDQLRVLVQAAAEQFVQNQGARLRAPVQLSIDSTGVHLHLAMVRPGIVDIDVDVDAVFQIFPQDCGIRVMYAQFSVDADLPWWLFLVDPVLVTIIEAFISNAIQGELRPALLEEFQQFLSGFIPSSSCICRVRLDTGQLSVLACPR